MMNHEVYRQLLATMTADPGADTDTQTTFEDLLLDQLDDTNPAVKLIVQHLAQRRAQEAEDDSFLEDEDPAPVAEDFYPDEKITIIPRQRIPSLQRLRRLIDDMYAELDVLRERNDALAEGLGACYLCWGEDEDCEVCQGGGRPGAFTPDKELFARLVAPVVRRLRRQEDFRKEGMHHG